VHLDVEIAWIGAVMLLALRVGPLFILAPGLGNAAVPVRVRAGLGLALAAILVSAHPDWRLQAPLEIGPWLAAAAAELVIGLAWAFGLFCAFGAFLFGGRLLDIQIGFGVATLFDPSNRAPSPLLGTGLNLMALAIFFAVDGHHQLIRAVAASLSTVPPGSGLAHLDGALVIAAFGSLFAFGLAVVAPAVITLLLLDVALGVVARTMPQMNIFIVAMPLKVGVGLLVLMLGIGQMSPLIRVLFQRLDAYLRNVVN
jgi:flagellar biosynthetic protein FliR